MTSVGRRILCGALVAELVVLTVSGIALYFEYRPSGGAAWADLDNAATVSVVFRTIHRAASALTIPTALGAGLWTVFDAISARGRWSWSAVTAVLVATAIAAAFTGYLLPWDQVALWAVTVGVDFDGYEWLFGDEARFVLLGGVEIGLDSIRRWLGVHLALGVFAGLAAVAITRAAFRRAAATSDARD